MVYCKECGASVENNATVCYKCGNQLPVVPENTRKVSMLVYFIGGLLLAIAPFCTYIKVSALGMSENGNMWKATDTSIIPTLILILGIVGMIVVFLELMGANDIPTAAKMVIPIFALVLFVIFEYIRKDASDSVLSGAGIYANLITITKGVGFYLNIGGIVSGILGVVIGERK